MVEPPGLGDFFKKNNAFLSIFLFNFLLTIMNLNYCRVQYSMSVRT